MWSEDISDDLDIYDLSIDALSLLDPDSMNISNEDKVIFKKNIEKRIILLSNSIFTTSTDVNTEIEATRNLINALSNKSNFIVESSWLIVNLTDNQCKCYCWWKKSIPIVCKKREKCNNFSNADESLTKINKKIDQDFIDDMY